MEGQEPCGPSGGNPASFFGAVFSAVKSSMSTAWNAATKDGTLAAAGRQGADELGMALKAFPDSIQADEPGTLWNPTQGEIAAARNPEQPSPSEIIRGGKAGLHSDNSKDAASLSPSQVAKADATNLYGPDQAKDQSSPSPAEVARDKGDVFMQEKSWREREIERQKAKEAGNAENDQNERAKGRSLPDEERQQEQERSRGR